MNIIIFGAGALGSTLLTNLCCDLRDNKEINFFVVDYDKIEQRNILPGTQYYFDDQVGMDKVKALRLNIYRLCQVKICDINVTIEDRDTLDKIFYHTPSEISQNSWLWIDCFDNKKSRQIIQDGYRKSSDCNLLHIGFSPNLTSEITWDEYYEVPDDIKGLDICELVGARSFIQTVSGIASTIIQKFINKNIKENILINNYISKKI